MKKPLLLFFIITLCLGCDLQKKQQSGREFPAESGNSPEKQAGWEFSSTLETKPAIEESGSTPEKKYTYEELKTEFSDSFSTYEIPIGTYFWDEFGGLEAQYGLSADESKLLGEWMNVTFTNLSYNYYTFFPNKLFLLNFNFKNFRVIEAEEAYFDKAVGVWEIAGGFVRVTIYAVVTEDRTKDRPDKGLFFLERPYSFDFINIIDDIDGRGFTVRPINNAIMSSEELRRKASILKPNRTNNLYVRNVYTIDFMNGSRKAYGYFDIVPEMARDGVSGYEVATDAGLIKKYIFGLWP